MSRNVIIHVVPEELLALTAKHLAFCVQGNSPCLTLLEMDNDDVPKLYLLVKPVVE